MSTWKLDFSKRSQNEGCKKVLSGFPFYRLKKSTLPYSKCCFLSTLAVYQHCFGGEGVICDNAEARISIKRVNIRPNDINRRAP